MEQPGKLSAVVACVGGAMRLFIPSRGLSRHVYYAAIGIGIAMTMNRTERKDVDRITSMVAFVMDNPAYAGALDFGEKLFGEYSKGMEPDPGFRVAKFVQLIDDGDWRRFC